MKDLLLLALFVAVPAAALAGDPVDPAPVTSAARGREDAGHGPRPEEERGSRDGGARPPAKEQQKGASTKDEKPCEPVKPCPID